VIDTHCHLDTDAFANDREEVLARARAAGVVGVLVPAIRPRTWGPLVELARKLPLVRIALGIHPQIVPELDPGEASSDLAEQLAAAIEAAGSRVVAVGECGIDGATADREQQEAILRAHVRAARAVKLPLVLHVFRAHDSVPRILREERADEVGGVLHSYSGGDQLVSVYRDLGMAFSFAGPITYTNARKPIAAAQVIPRDLLLAETDAPDQAPAMHRGSRSEPAFVADVIAGLAAARAVSVEEMAAWTTSNARRLFGDFAIASPGFAGARSPPAGGAKSID
jgi:TatD DNase family protein